MDKDNTKIPEITSWLTVEEAAEYLGIGKTVLYTLAREGKVPANKVGKKWTFEKNQIDEWMRSSKQTKRLKCLFDLSV